MHQDYKWSADLYVSDSVGGFPMGTANEEGKKWMCVQIADVHDSPVENLPLGNSILSGIGLMVDEK